MLPRTWMSALKHWILDCAHPLPACVYVYPGAPGTIKYAMVRRVLRHVGTMEGRLVEVSEGAEGDGEPALWWAHKEGEDPARTTGCLTVCRYLGRLWRLYPITPESAAEVDASLEQLTRLVVAMQSLWDEESSNKDLRGLDVAARRNLIARRHFLTHAKSLEARMSSEFAWLEGFSGASLADVCWAGAVEWLACTHGVMVDEDTTPLLAVWHAEVESLS